MLVGNFTDIKPHLTYACCICTICTHQVPAQGILHMHVCICQSKFISTTQKVELTGILNCRTGCTPPQMQSMPQPTYILVVQQPANERMVNRPELKWVWSIKPPESLVNYPSCLMLFKCQILQSRIYHFEYLFVQTSQMTPFINSVAYSILMLVLCSQNIRRF